MRVLITGINGFLGQYVAQRLQTVGHIIFGIGSAQQSSVPIDRYYCAKLGDPNSFSYLQHTLEPFDCLIHLAANLSMDLRDPDIIQDNVTGTQQILELASKFNCNIVIYMSSIMVYGIPAAIPLNEEHPIQCLTLYHYTKYWGENLVQLYHKQQQIGRCVIFRLTSPIGPGMSKTTFLSSILKKFMDGSVVFLYGDGTRVQNYIDVRDVCCAIQLAMQRDIHGIFNLGGKHSYTNLQVASLCKTLLHSASPIRFQGQDEHEKEHWILQHDRICQLLGFVPQYDLPDTVSWLLHKGLA